jgi:membrane protease YdiL (CAAX protease family)
MPAAHTLAILRDAFVVAMIALAVAAAVYAMVRRFSEKAWNAEGNVLTRPYGAPDSVVALLLLGLFGFAFFSPAGPGGAGDRIPAEQITVSVLVAQSLFMLLLCLGVLVYLGVIRGLNPAEMFGLRQMPLIRVFIWSVLALILTFIVMIGGTEVIESWSGGNLPDQSVQETVEAFEKNDSLAFRLMLAAMAILVAPLTEELLFRGFLYGVIKSRTDRWFSAVFTSLIFAIIHFHVGSAPQLFLLGMGLAIAYEQTGSLLVPIVMHAIFNGCTIAVLAATASGT